MYDFETLVDRRGTTSSKWHMIETDNDRNRYGAGQ